MGLQTSPPEAVGADVNGEQEALASRLKEHAADEAGRAAVVAAVAEQLQLAPASPSAHTAAASAAAAAALAAASPGVFQRQAGFDAEGVGWQGRGDYHQNKIAKLRLRKLDGNPASHIFAGVVVHINGRTEPTRDILWGLIAQHGGLFEQYICPAVTHIVVSELPDNKVQQYHRQPVKNRKPIVLPSWITDSIAAGSLKPWRTYLFPRLADRNQSTFAVAAPAAAAIGIASPVRAARAVVPVASPVRAPVASPVRAPVANQQGHLVATAAGGQAEADTGGADPLINGSTKTDPDFVRKYFSRSRLHHIGTSRGRYQAYVASVCCNPRRDLPQENPSAEARGRVIVHIDMDCFFASVAVRTRPHLRGRPFAVCFGQTANSRPTGEISSASYEARSFGIKAGMMSRDALKLCPGLLSAPYEFGAYQQVSDTIYDLFAQTVRRERGRIEAVSCDEAYLDISDLGETHPSEVVSSLRRQVFELTGCPCSAGVGPNKLVARLSTAAAKPNGQRLMLPSESAGAGSPATVSDGTDAVESFLASLPVKELPGVGRSTMAKLCGLGLAAEMNCGAVRQLPLQVLQQCLGSTSGQALYNMVRGADNRPLETNHVRKTYSAEVNWGVRFDATDHDTLVRKFIDDIADYVSEQLTGLQLSARALGITVKRRQSGATQPYKRLGHGPCDNFSRSAALSAPTAATAPLSRAAWDLYQRLQVAPEDLRGFGIQCSKLESLLTTAENILPASRERTAEMTRFFKPVASKATADEAGTAAAAAGTDPRPTEGSPSAGALQERDGLGRNLEGAACAQRVPSEAAHPAESPQAASRAAATAESPSGHEVEVVRLSQLDPEVMSALGPAWRDQIISELDGSAAPDTSSNWPSRTASDQSTLPLERRQQSTETRSGLAAAASGGVQAAAEGQQTLGSSWGRPAKRRRAAQQQTLNRSWGDAGKWEKLQELCLNPAFAFLAEMPKEEQLKLYDDLNLEGQLQQQQRNHTGTSSERSDAMGAAPAAAAAAASGLAERSRRVGQPGTARRPGVSRQAAPAPTHSMTGQRAAFPAAADGLPMTEEPGRQELAAPSRPGGSGGLPDGGGTELAGPRCAQLVAPEESGSALLCAAYARVLREHPPTDSSVDVLSLGLWQLCSNGQLDDLAQVLKTLRRCVRGSQWRQPELHGGGGGGGWASGFNLILQRAQVIVGRQYHAQLPIEPV